MISGRLARLRRSSARSPAAGDALWADAGRLRQEASDRRRVAGVLLVSERDDTNARGLRLAAEVRDRNAGHTVDGLHAVERERLDDEMEAVGERPLGGIGVGGRRRGL